jgi:hypothetical protein
MMIKMLKDAVRQAESWPQEDQEELAEYAREIEGASHRRLCHVG